MEANPFIVLKKQRRAWAKKFKKIIAHNGKV